MLVLQIFPTSDQAAVKQPGRHSKWGQRLAAEVEAVLAERILPDHSRAHFARPTRVEPMWTVYSSAPGASDRRFDTRFASRPGGKRHPDFAQRPCRAGGSAG